MKFALCNEMFEQMPWPQALEISASLGYTGWELAPFTLGDAPTALSAQRRAEIREAIHSAGLEVVGLHWLLAKTSGFHLTTRDGETRRRTSEYLADLARLCRDLDGHVMVLGSPQQRNFPADMTHDEAQHNARQVIEAIVPTLEACQVVLALEPLGPSEGNFWNHAADAVELIEQIQSPWVQLHLDCKAMSSEGEPLDEIIRRNAKYLAHFHANDPNLLGPGMGELDIVPVFRALQEIGYDRWVSVEVFDYAPGVVEIARQSMANMQAALQQLS
ncbi:MAG: tagatose 3-epimerase [Pirellulaceae bacterium]|nr:MAG: tagatose 3-epimerase [Pirellulaceae bacterium]